MHINYSTKFSKELQDRLLFEEGKRNHAYLDTKLKRTIGIGHNLSANPKWPDTGIPIGDTITDDECFKLLELDLLEISDELVIAWPNYKDLQRARKDAILSMAFQLGVHSLMKFVMFKMYVDHGNWVNAKIAGRQSLWYEQTTKRAERVLTQLSENIYYEIPTK
jgi:lysozyme